uniref:Acetyl-coenzyme A carboxylase carboxyl transferase subunit beta, chloroplastic n=1 Tax=Mirabilis himalaica TaxID=482968 RepID=A0A6M9TTL9_9CARY|nr:acetyl-CoA carboxylase carboxyltransferase beta subunit [Mirabilis himalaica]QKN19405.1 acetyl-CoA carboxylase carboxyltransferase beta subunit [Mirabilis himalaica]
MDCGLSKSMESLGPIENTSRGEDPNFNDTEKNIDSSRNNDSSNYSNADHFFRAMDIRNFISDDTFLLRNSRNSKGDSYSIYFDIENPIFEIDSELQSSFLNYSNSSYLTTRSKSDDPYNDHYRYDTKYSRHSWHNHINNCIDSYLHSQIRIGSSILSGSDNSILSGSDNYIFELHFERKYKMNICEQCGYHLKMSSSDRIELLIDQGTWNPMDEDMVSTDPIEFNSEEESYKDRIDSYQRKTGLTEVVQTGIGQLNGIPVAIGVMYFQFMGGSMGSVVGEKITRLVEYATKKCLPLILIIVCASGGARMQEGSLSLMQMAKISSVLYDYQSNKKLFYVSILTSPTTGGVTAGFGMLGDIIIAEPNAHIAFAGKRVIEQTLNKTVPEGSQAAEYLFHKGLFDSIVPCNLLKGVLSELFQLHAFFPLNQVEH